MKRVCITLTPALPALRGCPTHERLFLRRPQLLTQAKRSASHITPGLSDVVFVVTCGDIGWIRSYFLEGMPIMPGPLSACRPDFPTAFVAQFQQLVTRRTVKYQLRQQASLVLLVHAQPLLSHVEGGCTGGFAPGRCPPLEAAMGQGGVLLAR
jgi:hypothetical protein